MLTVTEAAKDYLRMLLNETDADDSAVVRLVVTDAGVDLAVDAPGPDDETIEHEGSPLLVLDEEVSEMFDGRTLDLREDDEGPRLLLN